MSSIACWRETTIQSLSVTCCSAGCEIPPPLIPADSGFILIFLCYPLLISSITFNIFHSPLLFPIPLALKHSFSNNMSYRVSLSLFKYTQRFLFSFILFITCSLLTLSIHLILFLLLHTYISNVLIIFIFLIRRVQVFTEHSTRSTALVFKH